ncbi:MAG: hypothetical protein E6G17_04145, partial [Actinobacteria bacterium]
MGLLVLGAVALVPRSKLVPAQAASPGPEVEANAHHDTSPPLRDIPPASPSGRHAHARRPLPGSPAGNNGPDPVVQSAAAPLAMPAATTFEGVGLGLSPTVDSVPPDPNGSVGLTDFVEVTNESFAVFRKSDHAVLKGPVRTNTLWSGFGGGCEAHDDGDATVKYDRLADRWVFQQFAVLVKPLVLASPLLVCVAVSVLGNPTGSYHRYSFALSTFFPDYPKLAVWPDAYYMSTDSFSGLGFSGARACALDRTRMLSGLSATRQCFQTTSSATPDGLLPSDLDGSVSPPAGSPAFFVGFTTTVLDLWKFHVDWTTPANSTFTGPAAIPVAAFTRACDSSCVPQLGTTRKLDALGDLTMYRLARWYEIRSPASAPWVFQQGTYAPDSTYRWMGSIAMDKSENMALGFSASSSSINPGIRYTGRLPGDPFGVMGQGEGTIINGTGSQFSHPTSGALDRWGDYTSMAVDPTDDCTFWYTNEYLAA